MINLFWFFAISGSLMFILRALMTLFSGFDTGHGEAHHDVDGTDHAFKVISIHSLTGFFMLFGWIGLASLEQFNAASLNAFIAAFAAGLLGMWLTSWLFYKASKLESHGERFELIQAIGKQAIVYQKIPEFGVGKIHLSINGIQRELGAKSVDGSSVESFVYVRVVDVIEPSICIVTKNNRS